MGVARGLERSSAFPRYVVLAVLPVLCHINDESGNRRFFLGGGCHRIYLRSPFHSGIKTDTANWVMSRVTRSSNHEALTQ